MAGENQFKYILNIGMEHGDFSRGLQQITAEIENLQRLAQTTSSQPGSVPVTAGGPGAANLATDTASLQGVADQLTKMARLAQTAGVALDRGLISKLESLASGGVIGQVGRSLEEGPRRVSGQQFSSVADAALQQQFVVAERGRLQFLDAYKAQLQQAGITPKPIPGAPVNLSRDELHDKATDLVTTTREQAQITGALKDRPDYIRDLAALRLNLQETSASVERMLGENNLYSKALADTRIAQAKTNAAVNQRLAAEESYVRSLAENAAAQKNIKAQEVKILASDQNYIESTASVANSRKLIAAKAKEAELKGVGLEPARDPRIILPPGVQEIIDDYSKDAAGGGLPPHMAWAGDSLQEEALAGKRASGRLQLQGLQARNAAEEAFQKAQQDRLNAVELWNFEESRSLQNQSTISSLTATRRGIEAQLNVALEEALAADTVYADASAQGAALRKIRLAKENAAVSTALSVSPDYQTAQVRSTQSEAFNDSVVKARLAEEGKYAESLAAGKLAQEQINAKTAQILAADNAYIEATAATANARLLSAEKTKAAQAQGVGLEGPSGIVLPPGVREDPADVAARRQAGLQNLASLKAENAAQGAIAKAKQQVLVAEKTNELDRQRIWQGDASISQLTAQRLKLELIQTNFLQSELVYDAEYVQLKGEAVAYEKVQQALTKATTQKVLLADNQYAQATAEAANARRASAAFIKEKELQGAGLGIRLPDSASSEDKAAAQSAGLRTLQEVEAGNARKASLQAAEMKLAEAKIPYSKAELTLIAEANAAQARQNQAIKNETAVIQQQIYKRDVANNLRDPGTRFQQFQSQLAGRSGGEFKDPLQYQQFGQFVKSKFLTTAGFAVSGIATYGAISGIQNMVKESSELEKSLSQIRAQFDALGQGDSFAPFREGILDISRASGELATEVAQIATQFKGAFGETKSNVQILQEVNAAVQISRVTGLGLAEVTDSLTATALDYGTSVEHVGDVTLALQDQTGVLASHIITAVADLAPTADSIGLEMEKVAAIAAVAQKTSGQSGAVLAESLNRIFPTIQEKSGEIIEFFRQVLPDQAGAVIKDLAAGQTGQVFDRIGTNFKSLTDTQQKYALSLLGTRRDLKGLIPVFQNYDQVIEANETALDSAGRLSRSYGEFQKTLSAQIERAVASLKSMGVAILSLGISDAVQDLAKVFGVLIGFVSDAVNVFAEFNEALFGIPGKLAGAAIAATVLYKALKAIRDLGALSALQGLAANIPGGAAGAKLFQSQKQANAAAGLSTAGALASGLVHAGDPMMKDPEAITAAKKGIVERLKTFGKAISVEAAATGGYLALAGQKMAAGFALLKTALKGFLPIILGVIAIEQVTNTIKGFRQARASQQEFLSKQSLQTLPQLQEGGDQEALKEYENQSQTKLQKRGVFEAFKEYTTNPTQLFKDAGKTLARKDAGDITAEAVRQKTSEAFATVLKQQFSKDDLKELTDNYNAGVDRFNSKLRDEANRTGGPAGAPKQKLTSKEFAEIVKKGTTDSSTFDAVIDLFTLASEQKKGLGEQYAELIGQRETVEKAQQDFVELPTLQIKQSIGAISARDFVTKARSVREGLVITLNEAIRNNLPADQIKTIKESLDATDQAIAQVEGKYLQELVQAKTFASTIRGDQPVQTANIAAAANLDALRAPGALESNEAPGLARAYVEAQKERLKFLIANAKSGAEADKYIKEGIKVPAEIKQALDTEQLKLALPPDVDRALRETIDRTLKDNYDETILRIVQTKGGIKKGIEEIIKELERQIAILIREGGHDQAVALAQGRLRILKDSVKTSAFDSKVPGFIKDEGAGPLEPLEKNDLAADYYKSLTDSPVEDATIELNRAKRQLELTAPSDKRAYTAAAIAVNEANRALADALKTNADGAFAIAAALAADDPVQAAQVALDQANYAYNTAKANGDKEGMDQATASRIQAERQQRDAFEGITEAKFGLLAAVVADDPIKSAQVSLALAQHQIATARNDTDRLNALAAEISAQHQLRDLLNAAADAQTNVAIAIASAQGDVVEAAQLSFDLAKKQLARDLSQGIDPKSERGQQGVINVIQAQAALRDTTVSDGVDQIQFLLDTGKISTQQAITRLKRLDAAHKQGAAEERQIKRQIHQLQQQTQQDLQFNLPTNIKLPTLYEARRFNQGGGGTGGSNYNDNRKIEIRISTNAKLDGKDVDVLVGHVSDAINAPPRFGTRPRSY